MVAIFKSSLPNLSPLPTRLKVKSTDLAMLWTKLLCEICFVNYHSVEKI